MLRKHARIADIRLAEQAKAESDAAAGRMRDARKDAERKLAAERETIIGPLARLREANHLADLMTRALRGPQP